MSWAQRAADNLLPLSVERSDLGVALREWVYERNVVVLESPSEVCQLCDHPGIRYQFEIVNHETGHSLYIGSECIKRFAISNTLLIFFRFSWKNIFHERLHLL